MSNFWDLIQLLLSTFVLIVYLLILFQIIGDLFRDSELGGGYKVLWIIGLIILPGLTAIVYIIARGRGIRRPEPRGPPSCLRSRHSY